MQVATETESHREGTQIQEDTETVKFRDRGTQRKGDPETGRHRKREKHRQRHLYIKFLPFWGQRIIVRLSH